MYKKVLCLLKNHTISLYPAQRLVLFWDLDLGGGPFRMDTGSIITSNLKRNLRVNSGDDVPTELVSKDSSINQFIKTYQNKIVFLFDCIKVAVFIFLFLFIHTKVNAQTLEEQRLRSVSPWNFLNDFTIDTNAQDVNAIDNSSGVTYTTGFRYKLSSKRNFWAFGRLSKRFTGEERFDPLDTILRVEQVLDQKILSMSTRARVDVTLPTNEFIREQTSFVGALGGQLRLTKVLPYKLFFALNNNLRWNFHDYRVSELGIANIQASASTLATLSYAATPKIQTTVSLGWSLAKSYENTFTDFYSIDLSASYVLTDQWSILGGWTTAGSPFTADGQNSNIRLFDERDTTFYFSLTHFM